MERYTMWMDWNITVYIEMQKAKNNQENVKEEKWGGLYSDIKT